MELTPEDKTRIEKQAGWFEDTHPYDALHEAYYEGAEYENKYQREQQAELIGKLQARLDRCRKVSGYSSGFSDIHNEIDFLDLLLNSLKK